MIKSAEETSHLEHFKDRRSQADGDRLMVESLRRRDHPEKFRDVWTAGPSPRRKARSVFPIRRINLWTTPSRMPRPDVNGKTTRNLPCRMRIDGGIYADCKQRHNAGDEGRGRSCR